WRDLLINLAAGLIVVLLTVFGIDRVLRLDRQAEWAGVEARVNHRLLQLGTATISAVRSACLLPPDVLDLAALTSDVFDKMRQEMIRVAIEVLKPSLNRINDLDNAGWRSFTQNLQGTYTRIDQLLAMFRRELPAELVQILLDIQWTTEGMVQSFYTFHDVYGIPASRFSLGRRGRDIELQAALTESAIRTTGLLLNECVALLGALKLSDFTIQS